VSHQAAPASAVHAHAGDARRAPLRCACSARRGREVLHEVLHGGCPRTTHRRHVDAAGDPCGAKRHGAEVLEVGPVPQAERAVARHGDVFVDGLAVEYLVDLACARAPSIAAQSGRALPNRSEVCPAVRGSAAGQATHGDASWAVLSEQAGTRLEACLPAGMPQSTKACLIPARQPRR